MHFSIFKQRLKSQVKIKNITIIKVLWSYLILLFVILKLQELSDRKQRNNYIINIKLNLVLAINFLTQTIQSYDIQ